MPKVLVSEFFGHRRLSNISRTEWDDYVSNAKVRNQVLDTGLTFSCLESKRSLNQ